jgi:hypothetical protein
MTYRWVRYQEKYAYGLGQVEYIELNLSGPLGEKSRIGKDDSELIREIGSELEGRQLISNWSDKWRGVDLQFVEAPPRELMERAVQGAKARLEDAARTLVRYEAQLEALPPPERLPESKL